MASRELKDLVGAWRRLEDRGSAILATVVHTEGSTYRKVGARMLFSREGSLAGSVSGGCLEADLLGKAGSLADPLTVTYDSTAESDIVWGFGLGCNGIVKILLQPGALAASVMALLEQVLDSRKTLVLDTCVEEGSSLGRFQVAEPESEAENGWLREHVEPPKRVLAFGAGFDAPPLVRIAQEIGWDVTVVDHRSELLAKLPFAETVQAHPGRAPGELIEEADAIVVMTHNYLNDLAILRQISAHGPRYVGLLGPAARRRRLQSELDRPIALSSPAGLDIGASGPHEIALAIVAEIQADLNGRAGGRLSVGKELTPSCR